LKSPDERYRWFRATFKNQKTSETRDYHFRGFTVAERRRAGSLELSAEAEIFLLECCVHEQPDWWVEDRAIVLRLFKEICYVSGWSAEGIPLVQANDWIEDEIGMQEAKAVATIQGLTIEHLDTCDPLNYFKYLKLGNVLWERITQERQQEAPGPPPGTPKVKGVNPQAIQEVDGFNWQRGG
jgi:hypothetical protein